MEGEALGGEFVVKLLDERLEFRAFELEAELGDLAFEKFLVAEIDPIGRFHVGCSVAGGGGMTKSKGTK
jgi:hypothetical protein